MRRQPAVRVYDLPEEIRPQAHNESPFVHQTQGLFYEIHFERVNLYVLLIFIQIFNRNSIIIIRSFTRYVLYFIYH